ncbi:hypothetical protein EI94DRAFT_1722494 [Lactarius quietus]|nr:hypothetical protein EI94DRAFT_1722494 [Lactarius quietus]
MFFALTIVPLCCLATLVSPRWDNLKVKHSWKTVPVNWESLGHPHWPHRENALITALDEVSSPRHPKYGAYLLRAGGKLVMPHPDTLGLANDLLGASYQLYRHTKTNETILRTVGYSLPAALHLHVRTRAHSSAVGSHDDNPEFTVPVKAPFLRWLYNSEPYVPAATGRNKLAATFSVVLVNNGQYNPNAPGVEGSLDIQYTSAMAYPTPITYYNTGKGPLGEHDPYLSWLDYILRQSIIPQTITTSYADLEKNFPRIMRSLVLFSSGDYGVGPENCVTDGAVRFTPTFPASCPYVTSVGGTFNNPEEAMDLSSGDYQDVVYDGLYKYVRCHNPN